MEATQKKNHLAQLLTTYDDKHLAFYHYLQAAYIESGMDVMDFADQLLSTAQDFREKALDNEV